MAVVAGRRGGLQCKVVELVPSEAEGPPGEGDATSTSICPHAICFPPPPALVPCHLAVLVSCWGGAGWCSSG